MRSLWQLGLVLSLASSPTRAHADRVAPIARAHRDAAPSRGRGAPLLGFGIQGATGLLARPTTAAETVRRSIYVIAHVAPGEMAWRPAFGSRLHELRGEPNDRATADRAAAHLAEALTRWQPQLQHLHVTAEPSLGGNAIDLRVSYRIAHAAETQSVQLSYPLDR